MQTTMDVTSLPTPEMTKEQYRSSLVRHGLGDPKEWMDCLVSLDKVGWHATAQQLYLSGTGVQYKILRLESVLGFRVVTGTGRVMQITWMGRALLDRYNNLPD